MELFCPSFLCLLLVAYSSSLHYLPTRQDCSVPPPAGHSAACTPRRRRCLHFTPSCGSQPPVFGAKCRPRMDSAARCVSGCQHAIGWTTRL